MVGGETVGSEIGCLGDAKEEDEGKQAPKVAEEGGGAGTEGGAKPVGVKPCARTGADAASEGQMGECTQ